MFPKKAAFKEVVLGWETTAGVETFMGVVKAPAVIATIPATRMRIENFILIIFR